MRHLDRNYSLFIATIDLNFIAHQATSFGLAR